MQRTAEKKPSGQPPTPHQKSSVKRRERRYVKKLNAAFLSLVMMLLLAAGWGLPWERYLYRAAGELTVAAVRFITYTLTPTPATPEAPAFAHYLANNAERYAAFEAQHPGMPADKIYALVNAGVDLADYEQLTVVDNPSGLLVLCSKHFVLPEGYAPTISAGDSLRAAAQGAYESMQSDMGLPLYIRSGYRSYEMQHALHGAYLATARQMGYSIPVDDYSARAGHSEHQTGLAMDVLHLGGHSLVGAGFELTEQYRWLKANAHKYGFIERYPLGQEAITGYMYEPWHWRYIGIDAATRMHSEGIETFEEYCGRYKIPNQ